MSNTEIQKMQDQLDIANKISSGNLSDDEIQYWANKGLLNEAGYPTDAFYSLHARLERKIYFYSQEQNSSCSQ